MKHLVHFFTSILLAFVLLYIDESRFSFKLDAGNIFFLIVFVLFFFSGQYIIYRILVVYKEIYRTWHSVVIGLPLGLIMYYAAIIIIFLTRRYIG